MGETSERIPQEVHIKPAFIERYKELLGERYDEFMDYSLRYAQKAIRINTLKTTTNEIQKRLKEKWVLEPVPWCPEGFFITYRDGKRFDIGNIPEHQLGYFYVQDAASMIPPVVLAPEPGMKVLDLCAAPGSKTTQMAAMMQNEGTLIANDWDVSRVRPLGLNLQRTGIMNVVTVIRGNRRLADGSFDRVLVDAPCSGTGTIRRSLKTLLMWSPGLVKKLVRTQRKLIEEGFASLKPGGVLVYSTCTQEPEENEGIVSWLLEKYPDAQVEPIDLNIVRSAAILSWDETEYHHSVKDCLRIYPQDNNTEGFFVCKIKKRN